MCRHVEIIPDIVLSDVGFLCFCNHHFLLPANLSFHQLYSFAASQLHSLNLILNLYIVKPQIRLFSLNITFSI